MVKKSTKLNNSYCFCIVVVCLLLLAGYFILSDNNLLGMSENFVGELNTSGGLNNVLQKPNPGPNDVVFVLIYVDWCPHCKTIKPDWKNLVNNHNNTKVNGKNVQVVSVNAEGSEVEREVANDLNAKGYPTIKVLKNNEVKEHQGGRDLNSLNELTPLLHLLYLNHQLLNS